MRRKKLVKKGMAFLLSACMIVGMAVPSAAAADMAVAEEMEGESLLPEGNTAAEAESSLPEESPAVIEEKGTEASSSDVRPAGFWDGEGGANVTWRVDDEVLYFEGSGAIDDYYYENQGADDPAPTVTTAPWGRFSQSVTEVEIGDGITSIGEYAFNGFEELKSVKLPASLTTIGDWAFEYCIKLSTINFPEGLTSIGGRAFASCEELSRVDLPEGLTSIGEVAFIGCVNLRTVNFPESLKSIGKRTFDGCDSLETIDLPKGVTSLEDDLFSGCSSLREVHLPEGLTSIEGRVFSLCGNLRAIDFPESLKSIGPYAFTDCGLKSVDLPEGLTYIGEEVFDGCEDLRSINLKAVNAPECEKSTLDGLNQHTVIYVPKDATGYQKAPWTNYIVIYGDSLSVKKVELSSEQYVYNGKARKPSVTATNTEGKKIPSKYYTVSYSKGLKKVGQYKVTVKFKGKYSGTVKRTFTIVPKGTSLSKLTATKNKIKVTWKKQTGDMDKYRLEYSDNKEFRASGELDTWGGDYGKNKTSGSISGLESGKTYYVRICTYKNVEVNGETVFFRSSWSKVKSIRTK